MLIDFVWPLVLPHWHTFGWVDFASNIFLCGLKMHSVKNSHFVNTVWIEQVLGLAVIHQSLCSWILLNHCSDSSTKVSFRSTEHVFKSPWKAQLFPSSFSVSIIIHIENFLSLKQNLWVKYKWTEYYTMIVYILWILCKYFSKHPIDLSCACRKGKLDQISDPEINSKILNEKDK